MEDDFPDVGLPFEEAGNTLRTAVIVCFQGKKHANANHSKARTSSYRGISVETKCFHIFLHVVYKVTFSLGIFFLAQPSQIIGYLGQISSCA